MKTIRIILTTFVVGAAWFGCSSDSTPSDTGPLDGRTDSRDAVSPADSQARARFCGTLEDPQGTPVDGGSVIVCNEHQCLTDTTGSTGAFCVNAAEPGDYVLHTEERTVGETNFGEVLFPLTLSEQEVESSKTIELGTVVVPLMGPGVDLDPQQGGTLDLGGGATLTIAAGTTVLPALMTEATLSLAAVPASQLHPKLVAHFPSGKDPAAIFAIMPVGVTFTAPVSFVLPAPSGLTAGATFDVYWVNPDIGIPEAHGEAKESAGTLVDETGKGLTALGWLLFFAK